MPAPVLEITPEMLDTGSDMGRAYSASVMLWFDDEAERGEMMKTATALHLKATLGPAAEKAVADHLDLWQLGFDAIPARKIRERHGTRGYHGTLAGEFLWRAVMADVHGEPLKLEHLKRDMTRRKIHGHKQADISRSLLVNKILPRFRPVAHLWAARHHMAFHGDRGFPCNAGHVPEFLSAVAFFREKALALKFPTRRDALLRDDEAWRLPPGLKLPQCEIVAFDISRVLELAGAA